MVSPSKKKKPDKRSRETAEPPDDSESHIETRKSNKSSKPLSDKKFYLDIKNHVSLKKLEEKLKSLGARLELFLVKDVDYVVTDRSDYPAQTKRGRPEQYQSPPTSRGAPSTPHHHLHPSPYCSVSPATADSPTDGVTYKRTRSRAEAMLECLKQQPSRVQTTTGGDVLDNAVSWRIPIYPLSRFIEWLEKVAKRAEKSESATSCGVKELRGNYLKIEAAGARPEFRLFESWPQIKLDLEEGGGGGFIHNRTTRSHAKANLHQRMTRKVGRGVRDISTGGGAGYCEVCRLQYGQLEEHVNSSTHLKLVSDPAQYSQLDSIISQHSLGPGSRKSLRIAKSPPPNLGEMGGKQSSSCGGGGRGGDATGTLTPGVILNGHHINTRSSKLYNNLSSPFQPQYQVHCNGVVGSQRVFTRSKGNSEPQHQQLVTTNEEVRVPSSGGGESGRTLRSKGSTPAKRSRVSKKRLSAEEKLIEDNKAYYKVEVLNSKLRSTGYMISQRQQDNRINNNSNQINGGDKAADPKAEEKEPVVVRFKKVRKTQLALLSDEAESFMFGEPTRREESSADEEEESDKESEVSEDSNSARGKRRRRRTHAEAFITDNLDYYKFETPGSRLRYQSPHVLLDKLQLPKQTAPPELQVDVDNERADQLKFSFESGLCKEAWWTTYKRQDEGGEVFVRQHYTYPTVALPYEIPHDRNGRGGGLPGRRREHRLVARLVGDDRPRKSPRCHASTLAIMSSLMRRGRPRSEDPAPPPSMSCGEEDTRSSLPDTFESSSNSELKMVSESDAKVLEGRVADMLATSFVSEFDRLGQAVLESKVTSHQRSAGKLHVELSSWPCLDVDPHILDGDLSAATIEPPGLTMDINSLLDTFHQCPAMDKSEFLVNDYLHYRPFDVFRSSNFDSCNSSDCSDVFGFSEDGRVVTGRRKKRKKRNMTGWPLGKPKRRQNQQLLVVKLEPPSHIASADDNALSQGGTGGWFDATRVKQEVILTTDELPLPPVVVKRKVGRPPKKKPPLLVESPQQPLPHQPSPVVVQTLSSPALSSPPPKKRRIGSFQARYRY